MFTRFGELFLANSRFCLGALDSGGHIVLISYLVVEGNESVLRPFVANCGGFGAGTALMLQ